MSFGGYYGAAPDLLHKKGKFFERAVLDCDEQAEIYAIMLN